MPSYRGLALALAALVAPLTAHAEADTGQRCESGVCHVRLTADQLLARADQLVSEHRFSEAAPYLAALEQSGQLAMERQFLQGYAAVESGQLDDAIRVFRKILDTHPEQTRVRLELGRALMMQGKALNADYHFRLAGQAKGLPEDVLAMVRSTRSILRQQRSWNFNFDFGLAPDSNITNGTNAETVDLNLGAFSLPLTLDGNARAKSGTGQFLTMAGSARFGFIGESRLVVDANSQLTNYAGKAQDDIAAELSVGPQIDLSDNTTLTVQGLAAQRWYGGQRASTAFGLRAGIQKDIDPRQRLGFTVDARRNSSGFTAAYSGWQIGSYASYERAIARRFVASASLFGRRDALNSAAYADFEVGGSLGLAGELPLGLNAGVSAGASRAWYDAPLSLFSAQPRKDWRLNARAQIGLRSIRLFGFSPSVAYSYSASLSSLTLYDSKRSRVRFALARYF